MYYNGLMTDFGIIEGCAVTEANSNTNQVAVASPQRKGSVLALHEVRNSRFSLLLRGHSVGASSCARSNALLQQLLITIITVDDEKQTARSR